MSELFSSIEVPRLVAISTPQDNKHSELVPQDNTHSELVELARALDIFVIWRPKNDERVDIRSNAWWSAECKNRTANCTSNTLHVYKTRTANHTNYTCNVLDMQFVVLRTQLLSILSIIQKNSQAGGLAVSAEKTC
jgi:hypothetical protein